MQSTLKFSSLSREDRPKKYGFFNGNIFKKLTSIKILALMIIIFQIIILYLLINPINLLNQLNAVQVINKVSDLTLVPAGEIPSAIGTIGDNSLLPDVETLKKENDIQAQVYKDAKNGDYVIVYSNKMIIFRESENRIIYEGQTPVQILNNNQQTIVSNLIKKVKDSGIIANTNEEAPQLRIITTEIEDLKRSNPEFYGEVKENDIQAIFARENKIIIYRPDTDTIVKYGDLSIR